MALHLKLAAYPPSGYSAPLNTMTWGSYPSRSYIVYPAQGDYPDSICLIIILLVTFNSNTPLLTVQWMPMCIQ